MSKQADLAAVTDGGEAPPPAAPPPVPDAPADPGPSFDQQAAAHAARVDQTRLPDMAVTGGLAGLGLGALASLLRRRRRPPSPYGGLDAGPVEMPKLAAPLFDPAQMGQDPAYGLKLVGGIGLPLLGGFALAKGVGDWRRKQKERDEADAVKREYQQALQGYAAGPKLASERSALDRLAEDYVKRASPDALNGYGLLGNDNALVNTANIAANVALPAAALFGGYHLLKGFNTARADKRKLEDAKAEAVADWRRKQLFYAPPPITAVEPAA